MLAMDMPMVIKEMILNRKENFPHQLSILTDNRLSILSENSSSYSISSSPGISLNQQQRPTAPSEA